MYEYIIYDCDLYKKKLLATLNVFKINKDLPYNFGCVYSCHEYQHNS